MDLRVEYLPYLLPENDEEFLNFVKKFNRTQTGNTTLLTQELINSFRQFNTIFVQMKKKDQLIGSLLTIPLPIRFQEKDEIMGLVSFLCLHPSLRGLGLGKSLIGKLIEIGKKENIYNGYYISPKKSSLPISMWYRPLNLPKLSSLGFLSYDPSQKLKYRVRLPPSFVVHHITQDPDDRVRSFYLSSSHQYKLFYNPSHFHWDLWIKNFPTYTIEKNHDIIGLFSLGHLLMMVKEETLTIDNLLLSAGDWNLVLKASIMTSRADLLYGYILGGLNPSIVEAYRGLMGKQDIYFHVMSCTGDLSLKEIMVPIW